MKTIALEEHFGTPKIAAAVRATGKMLSRKTQERIVEKLKDVGEGRLADMDAAGIDVQVLSATGVGLDKLDPKTGTIPGPRKQRCARRDRPTPPRPFRHRCPSGHAGPGGGRSRAGALRGQTRIQGRPDQRDDQRSVPRRPDLRACSRPGGEAGRSPVPPPRPAARGGVQGLFQRPARER